MKLILILTISLISTAATAKTHVVLQEGKKFNIKKLEIKLGDTIEFKNMEKSIIHNVYSLTKNNGFDLKTQKPGKSSKETFKSPAHKIGKVMIECAIHPTMQLAVNVLGAGAEAAKKKKAVKK